MTQTTQRFANDATSPAKARRFVRENSTLDAMRYTETDLLVTELVTNVVRHVPDAGWVEVSLSLDPPNGLRVSVSSPAKIDLSEVEHGVGLRVVSTLSRTWGYRLEGGVLHAWFTVRTPGSVAISPSVSDEELFQRMASDPQAHSEELVRRHSDLASAIARRYRGRGLDDEDLDQVAHMALLKAIQRYDPEYGEIRPFAAVTISGELKKFFRDRAWSVRVPRSLQEKSLEVAGAVEELTHNLRREPNPEELADNLNMRTDEVDEALKAGMAYSANSIEKTSDQTGLRLLDRLDAADPAMLNAEERVMIQTAIRTLPVRQQQILILRFEEDLTQSEIGDLLDISQMHVSRLLGQSLEALRESLGDDGSSE